MRCNSSKHLAAASLLTINMINLSICPIQIFAHTREVCSFSIEPPFNPSATLSRFAPDLRMIYCVVAVSFCFNNFEISSKFFGAFTARCNRTTRQLLRRTTRSRVVILAVSTISNNGFFETFSRSLCGLSKHTFIYVTGLLVFFIDNYDKELTKQNEFD